MLKRLDLRPAPLWAPAADRGAEDRRTDHRHGLKPHRVASFKISRDPKFAEKLEAIVGLYLSPLQRALGLCVDEKSQIQARYRTQPGLPSEGRPISHPNPRLQAVT
jgi:hypothetical protein